MNKLKGILPILLAALIFISSCSDDEHTGEPPAMPPASSMQPDFSYFNEEDNSGGRVDIINSWLYAATNVTIYSAILNGALIVPVTAYKVALEQNAEFDENLDVWVWAYDVNVGGAGEFQVRLTADVGNNEVVWTGDISKAGAFENFVWFEGTSEISGESGAWTLYESHSNPVPWLSAEWSKSEVEDKANAIFTVEKTGASHGSSISYDASLAGDFNRSVTIIDTNASNSIFVDWNSETKEGRVKSAAHFEDEVFHCWDGNLQDTSCE